MSHESEDVLEQALRQDLPSSEAQTRLRRRLLAAGVAVGQGMATTAAAAGSTATSAGLVAKAAGLSWGMKVGLVAVVAIPSVGLWLDQRAPSASVPPRVATSSVAPAPVPVRVAAPERARAEPPALEAAAPAVAVAPAVPQHERATPEKVGVVSEPAVRAPSPSQSDFAPAPESPARAPEVGSTLADETRLLDAVFAELTAGNRARATQLIAEHEARYPQGLLQRERQRAKVRLSELSRGE